VTTNLTRAQIKKLKELPDEFTPQEDDWKAGKVFLDLVDLGLADWKDQRLPYSGGDVTVGPGSHGAWRWWVRRTAAGREAIGLPPLETSDKQNAS